ncbi:ABC transporter permease [Xanthobacter sp. KR7-65]|uniref:ABC transporter permease n=1 Tax=Xanthobacter sp. KR7-65 TaxID=3156612 RepID=UPI0032B5E441
MSTAASGTKEQVLAVALPVLVGLGALAAWQIVTRAFAISPVLLPAPSDIASSFGTIAGVLARNAWQTGSEALVAFGLSAVLGVVAALVLTSSAVVFQAFYPHVVVFQIIPKIALAPLFVFWLGFESPSRLSYSVFISFFPVALATMTGLDRADANALRLCRALTASRWQTLFLVRVPYALPYFFSGLKIAATMSVIGIVVGEFISSKSGLGHYILTAQSRSETTFIFAALVVLCIVGLVPYAIAVTGERLARKWWRG